MNRSLPEAQAYIDALYQDRPYALPYAQGIFDMIKPDISITAHGPSASDVAIYYNKVLNILDHEIPHDKRADIAQELTAIWLKGQMEATVERTRQADDGPFRISLEGKAPIQLHEGGTPWQSPEGRRDD